MGAGAVKVKFRGLAGRNVNAKQSAAAGWRYGFVCVTLQGKTIYGRMSAKPKGSLTFRLPKDDAAAHLYLVVMGAPKEHWVNPIEEKDAQWPYQVKFKGTKIIEN
jgi:hypothetical protein